MVIPLALEVVPIAKESLIRAESRDIHTKVAGTTKAPDFYVSGT